MNWTLKLQRILYLKNIDGYKKLQLNYRNEENYNKKAMIDSNWWDKEYNEILQEEMHGRKLYERGKLAVTD